MQVKVFSLTQTKPGDKQEEPTELLLPQSYCSFFFPVSRRWQEALFKTNREGLIYSPQWSSWGDRIELVTTSWTADAPWAFWEIVAMYEQKIDSLSQRVPDKPRPSDMCLREGSCWQPQLAAVVSRFLHEEREMIWEPSIAIHDI